MQPVPANSLPIYTGTEVEITLPTGRKVRVRETNGEDDALLSTLGDSINGDNVYNFLASIIIHEETPEGKRKPLVDDLRKWPISDKYYLLFAQRLHNHGKTMEFEQECLSSKCKEKGIKNQFIQDLREFEGNFNDPEYTPKLKFQPKRYPHGLNPEVKFTTSSGKNLRIKILTGEGERRQLDMPSESLNRNTPLILRDLELMNQGQWQLVTNFHAFPSREMAEIRKIIDEIDPVFDPTVEATCPHCKVTLPLPLMGLTAFYFPESLT